MTVVVVLRHLGSSPSWRHVVAALASGVATGSYIVEFDVPAYPGLYPSFPVFFPMLRPEGLRAFHKQLAVTTNNTKNFTSSFGYLIVELAHPIYQSAPQQSV